MCLYRDIGNDRYMYQDDIVNTNLFCDIKCAYEIKAIEESNELI